MCVVIQLEQCRSTLDLGLHQTRGRDFDKVVAGKGFAERCEEVSAKAKDTGSCFSSENEMPEVRQDGGVRFLRLCLVMHLV